MDSSDDTLLPQAHQEGMMTMGEHLDVLRRMLIRIVIVVIVLATAVFCCKEWTFKMLLAPGSSDFVTYTAIERLCRVIGWKFHFEPFRLTLINTELSSQFITHLTTSIYLGLLGASPVVIVELMRFIMPALYDNERRYSYVVATAVYGLFVAGVLMSYYILFPFACRFLGTYQVDESVLNQINVGSYISTFTTLTFMMGIVFQIPVIAFVLGKMGVIDAELMTRYRRHAALLVMTVAAIITPPDLMTLILVAAPMYGLYELSVVIVRRVSPTPEDLIDT
ncbi:MAG: twin-arginine translocase subunit TatC [Muribaculaceae bacterium]|nr:twin-arginine translocase subunit TatC [Muribaculaceae bacterium]